MFEAVPLSQLAASSAQLYPGLNSWQGCFALLRGEGGARGPGSHSFVAGIRTFCPT